MNGSRMWLTPSIGWSSCLLAPASPPSTRGEGFAHRLTGQGEAECGDGDGETGYQGQARRGVEAFLGRDQHPAPFGHCWVGLAESEVGQCRHLDDGCGQVERGLDDRGRSEERRVGKECVSKGRSRWSPYH